MPSSRISGVESACCLMRFVIGSEKIAPKPRVERLLNVVGDVSFDKDRMEWDMERHRRVRDWCHLW
jgi:hypothetical protein